MHDLFVSYSRRDNQPGSGGQPGWIDAFIGALAAEHRQVAGLDLDVFFDREQIRAMDDWQNRILEGLRESHLLLACLSPHYFDSPYCRWEWEEYIKHEQGRAVGQEGVAPVYLIERPGLEECDVNPGLLPWVQDLMRRQFVDLRAFVVEGSEALQSENLRGRIQILDQQIADRLDRAARAGKAKGNVDRHNPEFVGRRRELLELRKALARGTVGVITAVHGLGGVGKTALATEYAHAYASEYGGGRWLVRCEGQRDLGAAMLQLLGPLGIEVSQDEAKDPEAALRHVLGALERRAHEAEAGGGRPTCLVALDNVDMPELLAPAVADRLPRVAWLHVLATTRLAPVELGEGAADRSFLSLDEMPEGEALAVIERYRPDRKFANEAEREAALQIVRELGGLALAVESVAVFLGLNPEVPCAEFLERLRREGVVAPDDVANEAGVKARLRHREKLVSAAIRPTIARLAPEETWVLELASLLPADHVPLPWLRAVAIERFPDLAAAPPVGYPDPWRRIERRLIGTRLLRETDDARIVRMHRLVGSLVRDEASARRAEQERTLVAYAKAQSDALWDGWVDPAARWELGPLVALAWQLMERDSLDGAYLANQTFQPLHQLARFSEAEPLIRRALAIDEKNLGQDHPVVARDLSNLAQLLQATNRLPEAEPLMRRALVFLEKGLGREHPRVATGLNNLAQLLQATNRLPEAESLMRRALAIDEKSLGKDHPNVARNLNDLAQVLQDMNRLPEAEPLIHRAIGIWEKALGRDHPEVATGLNNLAQIFQVTNRPAEAEALMRRALAIDERSLGQDHSNVARDLSNLALFLRNTHRLAESEPLMYRALDVYEKSLGQDHPNVATSLHNLACLLQDTNRFALAKPIMHRALSIFRSFSANTGHEHPHLSTAVAGYSSLLARMGLSPTEIESELRAPLGPPS